MPRQKRRAVKPDELNITSMMDMMTIILVFLLKSYSTDDITVQGGDLQLPVSSSLTPPKLAVNVIVSQSQILVDGEPVVALEAAADPDTGKMVPKVPDDEKLGPKILSLFEKLQAKADQSKALGERAASDEFDFKGQVLLQVDKRLPFSIVRDVMFTAGQAQFGEFRFVVIKGSG